MPAAGLAPGDPLQLAKLLERVDADVRVGTDTEWDPALEQALGGDESVAEARLGRRADADSGTRLGDQVELVVVRVRGVDDGRTRPEAAAASEQLDRADPVLGHALLDLAGLLVGVDVEHEPLALGVAADLLEPVGRAGADGVGGEPDAQPAAAQLLDLAQVLGHRALPEPRQPSARVCGEQKDELDAGIGCSVAGADGFREPEVVELPDRRVAGTEQLAVRDGVLAAHALGRLLLRQSEHRVAPRPEVPPAAAAAQRTLERVRVRVDEARKREPLHSGIIL